MTYKNIILGLLLLFSDHVFGQNKSFEIAGLYINTKDNQWMQGTDEEKRNVVWSVTIQKDGTFFYNYFYDKQLYLKLGLGKWTLKDSVLQLRFKSPDGKLLDWGKHKISDSYMTKDGLEIIDEYDEYIVRNNKLISLADGKIETRNNVVLFEKKK